MGKKAIGTLLLLLLLTACSIQETPAIAGGQWQAIEKQYPELAGKRAVEDRVVRIVDGDTFQLASGGKVRLVGVNTPEIHGKVQPYGQEAADFTKSRLLGKNVRLYADVSDTDRYGRFLRFVFLEGDDRMFNETLVAEGYAQTMTIPPDVTYAKRFTAAQRAARERGAGLWGGKPPAHGESESDSPSVAVGSKGEAEPSCPNPIKGNINSKGDKIYHVVGGAAYEKTKPEKWFCTEQEAQDAGFRKASR
jgi:micrococcal nuclease